MKKLMILLCVASIGFTACNNQPKEEVAVNPFFEEYDTPFGIPPFEDIKAEHYMPAFVKGMEESKKEIEAILTNPEPATFEKFKINARKKANINRASLKWEQQLNK